MLSLYPGSGCEISKKTPLRVGTENKVPIIRMNSPKNPKVKAKIQKAEPGKDKRPKGTATEIKNSKTKTKKPQKAITQKDLIQKIKLIESKTRFVPGADRSGIIGGIRSLKAGLKRKDDITKLSPRIENLLKKTESLVQKRKQKKASLPVPTYNRDLPIFEKKEEIIKAIQENPVVVISGSTGSGKTTQIPQFCLEAGLGVDGTIGCTQPRRIAALTVAARIKEELGDSEGIFTGYKIRFDDKSTRDSCIKVMTDGILLAEAQSDPYLNEYEVIIVDEAHERSLNIDFVLGILKKLLEKRKSHPLKLIITSATIDTEKFSKAFGNAPVIEVSGRMFPVDVEYLDDHAINQDEEKTYVELAAAMVDKLQSRRTGGDILVFMPTEADIRETCELINGRGWPGMEVMPLFARLPAKDQSRIFSRSSGRKVIVATNVAETSITVPGIRYVIDSGLARISNYTPRTRTTSLPVVPISRSSADQRMGRCGRVEKGVCIRLYSEEDFNDRELYTPPEILRANLAEVILRMISLSLGDVYRFPFIDPPRKPSIKDGMDLLTELGAIKAGSKTPQLTPTGRLMSKIPIDPRLSRMLIEAEELGCIREMSIIVSALSIRDPRERPSEKAGEADKAHAKFSHPESDFLSFVSLWDAYNLEEKKVKSKSGLKKFARANFISYLRMREWRDIHSQIMRILKETVIASENKTKQKPKKKEKQIPPRDSRELYEDIHKAILTGFLSNIAFGKEGNFYNAAKNRAAMLFPGSGLFSRGGEWIVAAEMVETSRLFARTAANIDVKWLEPIGGPLVKYSWHSPHWEKKRGEVTAMERATLYGLLIEAGRPVSYGKIEPQESREIFIRSALVESDIQGRFGFIEHNRELVEEVRDIENKIRRRDVLISEDNLFDFYDSRLGEVFDIRTLKRLIRTKGDSFLKMDKEMLYAYMPDKEEVSQFPTSVELGNKAFDCEYRFAPGTAKDGVTVTIPSNETSMVRGERLDWVVPGLLKDKIFAMMKGLPKKYRKNLVPIADTVEIIMQEMPQGNDSLINTLGKFIEKKFSLKIPAHAWPVDEIPDHLKMRVEITGVRGEKIAEGRDREVLATISDVDAEDPDLTEAKKGWEKIGLTTWDFPDLPESTLVFTSKKRKTKLYPALCVESDAVNDAENSSQKNGSLKKSVRLTLFSDPVVAENAHKKGIAALVAIIIGRDLKAIKNQIAIKGNDKEAAKYFGGTGRLEDMIVASLVGDSFEINIRNRDEFFKAIAEIVPEMRKKAADRRESALSIVRACAKARSGIYSLEVSNSGNPVLSDFFTELRQGLTSLVPENFLELYDRERLFHLERYIKAIEIRASRGVENFERDQAKAVKIAAFTQLLNEMLETITPSTSTVKASAIEEFFWMLEEFKVSQFAQELKTPFPISEKRLNKKYDKILIIE